MMENTNKPKLTHKILVLIAVIAFVLTGWLTGHILRFAFPALWHPPIEKITPQIQNGFESQGIRREVVLTENSDLRIFQNGGTLYLGQILLNPCGENTYYTSLPAKCRSASGELVQVGEDNFHIILTPEDK